MGTQEYTGRQTGKQATSPMAMRRRGVVAAAAALMAGLVARDLKDAQPAAAQAAVVIDTTNNGVGTTSIVTSGTPAFQGQSGVVGGTGVMGYMTVKGFGVKGQANDGLGVQGSVIGTGTVLAANIGVQGVNFSQGTGHTGVQGLVSSAPGVAVYDQSQTIAIEAINNGSGFARIGLQGTIGGPRTDTLASAIVAYNPNTGAQAYGVYSTVEAVAGTGIFAIAKAASGIGIQGLSNGTGGYGVIGSTNGGGSYAVWGYATGANSAAVLGQGVASSGSVAGLFVGNVQVSGNFVVVGGSKNGAVPHPDGSHRLLYCMESPEAWFEDFGTGTITAGKAEIKLDPDFAAVVDTSKLHVFVMEHGANNALHIATKSASGFTVEADARALAARGQKQSETNGTFSYRVVARRKDNPGERLARFTPFKARDVKPPEPVPFPYDTRRVAAQIEAAQQSVSGVNHKQ